MPGHYVPFLFQKPGQIICQVRRKVQTCPLESVLLGPYTLVEGREALIVQNLYDAPWRPCGEILLK